MKQVTSYLNTAGTPCLATTHILTKGSVVITRTEGEDTMIEVYWSEGVDESILLLAIPAKHVKDGLIANATRMLELALANGRERIAHNARLLITLLATK